MRDLWAQWGILHISLCNRTYHKKTSKTYKDSKGKRQAPPYLHTRPGTRTRSRWRGLCRRLRSGRAQRGTRCTPPRSRARGNLHRNGRKQNALETLLCPRDSPTPAGCAGGHALRCWSCGHPRTLTRKPREPDALRAPAAVPAANGGRAARGHAGDQGRQQHGQHPRSKSERAQTGTDVRPGVPPGPPARPAAARQGAMPPPPARGQTAPRQRPPRVRGVSCTSHWQTGHLIHWIHTGNTFCIFVTEFRWKRITSEWEALVELLSS